MVVVVVFVVGGFFVVISAVLGVGEFVIFIKSSAVFRVIIVGFRVVVVGVAVLIFFSVVAFVNRFRGSNVYF